MLNWELNFINKHFSGTLQDKLNSILYKLSRKYKNPAVFQLNKDGEDLGLIMSGIWGIWDNTVKCAFYETNSDYKDYYKNHDMIILMNQTYGHKKNTIKIEVKNSFEFRLDKFMPIVYIEYQLQKNDDEMKKKILPQISIYVNWYDRIKKCYKKGYK